MDDAVAAVAQEWGTRSARIATDHATSPSVAYILAWRNAGEPPKHKG